MKRRVLLKDTGPNQQKQPPGRRNTDVVKLADLARPAKESQMQHKTKATPQDDNTNNGDSEAAIEFDG